MKKITLLLFSVILFITSCEDNGLNLPIGPKPKPPVIYNPPVSSNVTVNLSGYRSVAINSVSRYLTETDLYMGGDGQYAYIDLEQSIIDLTSSLNQSVTIPGIDIATFSHDLASSINFPTYDGTDVNLLSLAPGLSSTYNTTQLSLLNNYFNVMYDATDAVTAQSFYTSSANGTNNNPTLSKEQKIAVLGVMEYANEYAKKYFNGGLDQTIQDVQALAAATNGRTSATCPINWRDVWRSGVAGGAAGMVRGAIIGATGGTVSLPGVGTVSGGVGGAVFGFAGGFGFGAGGALVQQVFWNCLMASPYVSSSSQHPLCDTFEKYQRNQVFCDKYNYHRITVYLLHP